MLRIGARRAAVFAAKPLAQQVAALFRRGEPGAWYDPSDMSTLFQDAAGTTPVTAVEQPVGLMLDLSGRGNHATQATTTKRPVYSRRVNLLTKTEQFEDAVWQKSRCSVTSNAVVGPDGLTSADKVIADTQSNPHFISTTAAHKSGTTCRISVYAKAGEWDTVMLFGANNTVGGRFDLSLGSYVSNVTGSPIAPTITPVGGGWYLLALSFVATADNQGVAIRITPSGGDSGAPGNGVAGLYLWGADSRPATDAHLPYQWVNTATDYDTDPSKFPAYLRFDGVDDAMQTGNIDFTGTDKMTVWAGVTKLSDASVSLILEFSPNYNTNPGSFYIAAPESTGVNGNYSIQGRGTVLAGFLATPTFLAPDIAVIAGTIDISSVSRILRRNGVMVSSDAVYMGTGSFSTKNLNLGARNQDSLFFNGRLYSLIVRGAQTPLSQIQATELYIKQKMRMP